MAAFLSYQASFQDSSFCFLSVFYSHRLVGVFFILWCVIHTEIGSGGTAALIPNFLSKLWLKVRDLQFEPGTLVHMHGASFSHGHTEPIVSPPK